MYGYLPTALNVSKLLNAKPGEWEGRIGDNSVLIVVKAVSKRVI